MGWKNNRKPKQSVSVSILIISNDPKLQFVFGFNCFGDITFEQSIIKLFDVIDEAFYVALSEPINKSINSLSTVVYFPMSLVPKLLCRCNFHFQTEYK